MLPQAHSRTLFPPPSPSRQSGREIRAFRLLLLLVFTAIAGSAADPAQELHNAVRRATGGQLQFSFEVRSRLEFRGPAEFGSGLETHANFVRTRFGLSYRPTSWLRLSALGQDSRAPILGRPAAGTQRDPFDVQESYLELFPSAKTGFGADLGRRMIQYGDTRLIGSPQWAYTARTIRYGPRLVAHRPRQI